MIQWAFAAKDARDQKKRLAKQKQEIMQARRKDPRPKHGEDPRC